MARRVITLRFAATCRDCGAHLPAGTQARWYGRGQTYCAGTHQGPRQDAQDGDQAEVDTRSAYARGDRSPGAVASHYDRHGVYTWDGRRIGSTCGCEDYPCCGH